MYRLLNAGFILVAMALPSAAKAEPLTYTPVIFEGNGNAYVLFNTLTDAEGNRGPYIVFPPVKATAAAENSSYKGVRGRLAIVDSKELDYFLMTTFRPSRHAWIGLRFNCKSQTWTYSNGKEFPAGGYTRWHPTMWRHPGGRHDLHCTNLDTYLQAFYAEGDLAPYWVLRDNRKGWEQFFVEYPLSEVETHEAPADNPELDVEEPSPDANENE